jgi:hypothetical protein
MSLPAASTLPSLDVAARGAPFVSVDAKSAVTTPGLDVAFRGAPFYAQGDASGGGGGGAGAAIGNFLAF